MSGERLLKALKEGRNIQCEENVSNIVDSESFKYVLSWVPTRYEYLKPVRIFLSSQNGFNLHTLLDKCENKEPLILLVKASGQGVFGAFVSSRIEKSGQYHGNGETFLFELFPSFRKYGWARTNQYFVMVGK